MPSPNFTPKRSIAFDQGIYTQEALLRSAYDCAGQGTFIVSRKDSQFVVSLADAPPKGFSWKLFIESATDHLLRLEAERQFGTIREILLLQALAPIKNVDSILPE